MRMDFHIEGGESRPRTRLFKAWGYEFVAFMVKLNLDRLMTSSEQDPKPLDDTSIAFFLENHGFAKHISFGRYCKTGWTEGFSEEFNQQYLKSFE